MSCPLPGADGELCFPPESGEAPFPRSPGSSWLVQGELLQFVLLFPCNLCG